MIWDYIDLIQSEVCKRVYFKKRARCQIQFLSSEPHVGPFWNAPWDRWRCGVVTAEATSPPAAYELKSLYKAYQVNYASIKEARPPCSMDRLQNPLPDLMHTLHGNESSIFSVLRNAMVRFIDSGVTVQMNSHPWHPRWESPPQHRSPCGVFAVCNYRFGWNIQLVEVHISRWSNERPSVFKHGNSSVFRNVSGRGRCCIAQL